MAAFVLLAIALTSAAVAIVVVPLVRPRKSGGAPALTAAVVSAAVIVVGGAALYAAWSNWSWRNAPAADSPASMVSRLVRRLEDHPDDRDGWLLLGRSYSVLEQQPLALRAYERADRLSGGRSAEALVGMAEALAMEDESQLDGRAGRLVERALALEPQNGKALFFGAATALRRGNLPVAHDRLTKLLALSPPENVRPLLERELATIDRQLAGGPAAAAAAAGGAGAKPTQSEVNSAAVRVKVRLSPALGAAPSSKGVLFVLVRNPGERGPPLAAKRLMSRFPQDVELTPADSMIAGHSFAAGEKVEVVARISRSGSPIGATGDPFGVVRYDVGTDGIVNLVIDQLTP